MTATYKRNKKFREEPIDYFILLRYGPHSVVVEALCYKLEGRGFEFR
jgi:hypothetical protein